MKRIDKHPPKATAIALGLLIALCATAGFAAPPDSSASDTAAEARPAKKTRTLGIVLYPRFELLDVYGPAEMFGNLPGELKVVTIAQKAGSVTSTQGPKVVAEYGFDDCPPLDLLLVPGGFGTLVEMNNPAMLDWVRKRAEQAEITMSVCSGSAILAKAGLLDGRRATSNKQYFSQIAAQGPKVDWIKNARWVDDGNMVTSSGVSAGMDMALHVIERLYGTESAERIADATEYQWHRDANDDPFARFAK